MSRYKRPINLKYGTCSSLLGQLSRNFEEHLDEEHDGSRDMITICPDCVDLYEIYMKQYGKEFRVN